MIEDPPDFVVEAETRMAASNNGFRIREPMVRGWACFRSTTVSGAIHLGGVGPSGPWFLAIEHPGVAAEIAAPSADRPGPGVARYAFATTRELHAAVADVYRLAKSLPDAPLAEFVDRTREMPRTTEAERLVVERVGQEVFRMALLRYWKGECPLTGIDDPDLLRASHIKPWAACETDAERLDVHNGLLLSALWDAAFDRGLVTFNDTGSVILSPRLSGAALAALGSPTAHIAVTKAHCVMLAWHRRSVFRQ